MDRPPIKRRDYVEDRETAIAGRLQQVASQAADLTLLSLLAEQMDVPSLIALNAQYPEVVGQATILSMLSRRFDLTYVATFEDFLVALVPEEPEEEEEDTVQAFFTRSSYDAEAEVQKLEALVERYLTEDPQRRDKMRAVGMTIKIGYVIERLASKGYPTEALLVFEKYYDFFSLPEGKGILTRGSVSAKKTPRELFSGTGQTALNMLEEAALRTQDPIFYQETLQIVNEKLALLGYNNLMLPDRLQEMKEYAVSLKNAFYDNDLKEYDKTIWKVIIEGYLEFLLVFYPVLLPLSLLSDAKIWTKFVGVVRKLAPDHRLDYRLLSPKIREGVERSIAKAQEEGLADALTKLEELGFQL